MLERTAEELLEEIIEEETPHEARERRRLMAEGRRLLVDDEGRSFELRAPTGEVELRVEVTARGPVLHFTGADLALRATGRVDLECDELALRARGRMSLESGDFEQRVAGSHEVAVRDDARLDAQAVAVTAETGDLALKANDDVTLNGLRVLMNVPTQEEIDARRRSVRSFQDLLAMPTDVLTGSGRMPPSPPKKRSDW